MAANQQGTLPCPSSAVLDNWLKNHEDAVIVGVNNFPISIQPWGKLFTDFQDRVAVTKAHEIGRLGPPGDGGVDWTFAAIRNNSSTRRRGQDHHYGPAGQQPRS